MPDGPFLHEQTPRPGPLDIHPSTRVWPPTLTMRVQLLDMHVRTVARFDLSAVNAYRWYPGAEPLDDLARCVVV